MHNASFLHVHPFMFSGSNSFPVKAYKHATGAALGPCSRSFRMIRDLTSTYRYALAIIHSHPLLHASARAVAYRPQLVN